MKIAPINLFSKVYQNNNDNLPKTTNFSTQKTNLLRSPVTDTVHFGSYETEQMNIIQNSITKLVQPYINENKDTFNKLARIGYDMQEKLKIYQDSEQKLFYKELDATQNDKIQKAHTLTQPAKKYHDNIIYFERLSETTQNSPYSTTEIKNFINQNKNKMTQNKELFSPFAQAANTIAELENKMNDELSTIRKTNSEEVRNLAIKKDEIVFRLMFSPYNDAVNIIKDFDELKKDFHKTPIYDTDKKIGRISEAIDDFKKDEQSRNEFPQTMKQILSANKDYAKTTKSKEEINQNYDDINTKMNEIINLYSNEIENYANSFDTSKIDYNEINQTLETQKDINNKLSELIQKAKDAYYEESFKKFEEGNGSQWDSFKD